MKKYINFCDFYSQFYQVLSQTFLLAKITEYEKRVSLESEVIELTFELFKKSKSRQRVIKKTDLAQINKSIIQEFKLNGSGFSYNTF